MDDMESILFQNTNTGGLMLAIHEPNKSPIFMDIDASFEGGSDDKVTVRTNNKNRTLSLTDGRLS